jgi:hypothetical protein
MRDQTILKQFIMSAFILHNFCTIKDRGYDIDIDALVAPPPRMLPPPAPVETRLRIAEAYSERAAIASVVLQAWCNQ